MDEVRIALRIEIRNQHRNEHSFGLMNQFWLCQDSDSEVEIPEAKMPR